MMIMNRQARRKDLQKERFHGESKNYHLIVGKFGKFLKRRQFIQTPQGIKVIEHYDSIGQNSNKNQSI